MGSTPNVCRWAYAFILSACFIALPLDTQADPPEASVAPQCNLVEPDNCFVETFNEMPTGGHGTNFTSPANFTFDLYYQAGSQSYQIYDLDNLRHILAFACYSTEITLPESRQYVTLLFAGGNNSSMNVLALNGSGQIIDAATKTNDVQTQGAEAVKLGPADDLISKLIVHCIGNNCGFSSGSDIAISEIRACNISAN